MSYGQFYRTVPLTRELDNICIAVVRRLPERLVPVISPTGRQELEQTDSFLDASVLADPTSY